MTLDLSQVKIYVRPGVTDMRKQINGLSVIVEEEMNRQAMSGALYSGPQCQHKIYPFLSLPQAGIFTSRLEV
jgi:hypothetical protein